MPARPAVPTDPEREERLGRVAVWLDPEDADWLSRHCCCADDAPEPDRQRCLRLRFRSGAALHKAGLTPSKARNPADRASREESG